MVLVSHGLGITWSWYHMVLVSHGLGITWSWYHMVLVLRGLNDVIAYLYCIQTEQSKMSEF